MRYRFEEIFEERVDGSLSPRQRIRVGGVIFGPGVAFNRGVAFGGVDFHQFREHEIEAEREGDILIIKGIY